MRIVLGVMMVAVIAGCVDGDQSREELLVSAASSLTDAFGRIERDFEQANPGVDVVLNLAGSATLREQILEGAPVDVFASANLENMYQVMAAGETVGSPEVFARNRLQIAVPEGNPAGVDGLVDFSKENLFLGLCADSVPCGDLARETLANAGITASIDTNEPGVRSLLAKIETGELDAGITYATDIVAADGAVEAVDIPDDVSVVADYPIVTVSGGTDQDMAAAFIDFVLSNEGQTILSELGFLDP